MRLVHYGICATGLLVGTNPQQKRMEHEPCALFLGCTPVPPFTNMDYRKTPSKSRISSISHTPTSNFNPSMDM